MPKLRWKYVFAAMCLTGIAITVFDRQPTILSYMALPLSAVMFALLLIFGLLEKEADLFDEQNRQAQPRKNAKKLAIHPSENVTAAMQPTLRS